MIFYGDVLKIQEWMWVLFIAKAGAAVSLF